ncbi:MAG: hypothetical protein AAF790_10200 [Planctomycetota bacterium]
MLALSVLAAGPAEAVVVDFLASDGVTVPSSPAQVNTTAPPDDPGWYRSLEDASGIYLGNQWILTASHLRQVSDPFTSVTLPSGTYDVIPNSRIYLSNPASFDGEALTPESDLMMFRLALPPGTDDRPEDVDPNLAADPFGTGLVQLASAPPAVGTEILMIGRGASRRTNTDDPAGHFDDLDGNRSGFRVRNTRIKTWGTNRVADDSDFQNNSDSNIAFIATIGNRDVIGQYTVFDSDLDNLQNVDTPTTYEARAAGGDSGGPVFFHENGQWVLGGIMHAVTLVTENTPSNEVPFGTGTVFTDISQPHYASQINALLANDFDLFEQVSGVSTDFVGYSIAGDINLDGVVSGDGTGDAATDDLAAFVAGWKYEQDTADIRSWVQGDLNQDGVVDLADFAELRAAYGGQINAGQLGALLSLGAVPEPSGCVLAGLAAGFAAGRRRRR